MRSRFAAHFPFPPARPGMIPGSDHGRAPLGPIIAFPQQRHSAPLRIVSCSGVVYKLSQEEIAVAAQLGGRLCVLRSGL